MFESFTDWFSGATQSTDEADANLKKEQAKYLAQLQRRLDNNEISQEYFNDQLWITRQSIGDPSDEAWSMFLQDVAAEAAKLPKKAQTALVETAKWTGETIGGVGGGFASSIAKGSANALWDNLKSSPAFLVLFIVGIVVVGWVFLKGPLKGAKIKAIPVPV